MMKYAVLALFLLCGAVNAEILTLNYELATQNTDGTPYTDPDGVNIYISQTDGGPYTLLKKVDHPGTTTQVDSTVGNLDGVYYFVARSLNLEGVESVDSGQVTHEFSATPAPPSNFVANGNLVAYSVQISEDVINTFPLEPCLLARFVTQTRVQTDFIASLRLP